MENYSIVLVLLAVTIGFSALADRIRLPYPVLLIAAGIGVGFLPAMPDIEINPEITFLIFLPPLLYDAAFNISFSVFKTNISTISSLAVSLVFITASGIAVLAHYLIPGMTWPLSFVLGSILSATDAVAAMSITKGLGLSHKTKTILEGESLINDASALVAYRFAVAAVTGTAFVFWKGAIEFIILMGGGFLVGFIVGRALAHILSWVRKNYMVTISLLMLMPFVTYLIAEDLHVSGVIAVVVLGLSIAYYSNVVFPDTLKQQSKSIWELIIFLLNGLIFILIGLQFPFMLKHIDQTRVPAYIGYGFLITVAALALRMARVFLQKIDLERSFTKGQKRVTEDALLDFRTTVIISWSGMRGIVSLAIAIGLPITLSDGTPFPERSAIIFISVVVVLFTLIGQGLTLPWVVRRLNNIYAKKGQ